MERRERKWGRREENAEGGSRSHGGGLWGATGGDAASAGVETAMPTWYLCVHRSPKHEGRNSRSYSLDTLSSSRGDSANAFPLL